MKIPGSLWLAGGLLAVAGAAGGAGLWVSHLEVLAQGRADGLALSGGHVEAGKAAIERYRCGACHEIPGIGDARGEVGPPLKGLYQRATLAGRLSNDPASLIRWIREPQEIEPGSAMPDLRVTDADARDIAAYLYAAR